MMNEQQVEAAVTQYLPLARKIAGERWAPGLDDGALFSAAMDGLWKACRSYDGRGKLTTRIGTMCRQKIIDYVRTQIGRADGTGAEKRGRHLSFVSLDHAEGDEGLPLAEQVAAQALEPWQWMDIRERLEAAGAH